MTKPFTFFGERLFSCLSSAGTILALLTWLNLDAIHATYVAALPDADRPAPREHLAFPVVRAIIIAVNALFRYIAARVFGDDADFVTIAHVSLHAVALPVLAGFMIGIWTALFPFGPGDAFGRGLTAFVLFCLIFFHEAFVCVSGLREYLKQNNGRAILTWIAPLVGWCGCFAVPAAILSLYYVTGVNIRDPRRASNSP